MHFEMFGGAVLVGIMTGWLAGIVMKGGGYGLVWDVIFGLGGSVVGSGIFQTLGAPRRGGAGQGFPRLSGGAPLIPPPPKIWPPPARPPQEGTPSGGLFPGGLWEGGGGRGSGKKK